MQLWRTASTYVVHILNHLLYMKQLMYGGAIGCTKGSIVRMLEQPQKDATGQITLETM